MTSINTTAMSASFMRRMALEIKDYTQETAWNIRIDPVPDYPYRFKASFPGPQETPYEGGIFNVNILMPREYPFRPPEIKFTTKVYHPNDEWCPALTLRTIMLSVQCLLSSVEIYDDPADAEIAMHYVTNKASFEETARAWTERYAGALDPGAEAQDGATSTGEVNP